MSVLSWLFETTIRVVGIVAGVVAVTRGDYLLGAFLFFVALFFDFEAFYEETED